MKLLWFQTKKKTKNKLQMKRENGLRLGYEKNTLPLNRIPEDKYKEDLPLKETLQDKNQDIIFTLSKLSKYSHKGNHIQYSSISFTREFDLIYIHRILAKTHKMGFKQCEHKNMNPKCKHKK